MFINPKDIDNFKSFPPLGSIYKIYSSHHVYICRGINLLSLLVLKCHLQEVGDCLFTAESQHPDQCLEKIMLYTHFVNESIK